MHHPHLVVPDFTKTIVLEYDAFWKGLGGVLMQDEWPLAFTTKHLSDRKLGNSIYEK